MPAAGEGSEEGDAFGQALPARLNGQGASLVVERDDGFVDVDGTDYLDGWPDRDVWALDQARGRVLDVGAGAGRAALWFDWLHLSPAELGELAGRAGWRTTELYAGVQYGACLARA